MSNESSTFISNPQCDAADVAGVREILMTTEKGKPANTIENFKTVFCRDPLLHDSIRLNLLTEQIDIVRALGWHRTTNALTDIDVKYLLLYFEQNYCLTSEKKLLAALTIVANENCYHPIRDVLNNLEYAPACIIFSVQRKAIMWRKCSSTFCWERSAGYSIRAVSMMRCSVWWAVREPENLHFFAFWQYRMSGFQMT